MSEPERKCPDESNGPGDVFRLAEEYRHASSLLYEMSRLKTDKSIRPGAPPWRFLAIHAIELYLNAFLISRGHPEAEIRKMQHDLARRTKMAVDYGLELRKKTKEHLAQLKSKNEYRIVRYEPKPSTKVSEITRVKQTLEELAQKTGKGIL